jgi:hypothetical protein
MSPQTITTETLKQITHLAADLKAPRITESAAGWPTTSATPADPRGLSRRRPQARRQCRPEVPKTPDHVTIWFAFHICPR